MYLLIHIFLLHNLAPHMNFSQLLMIECCHHYMWPQIPAFPVEQSYSCWLSSSSVRDCGWNSWIDAVFVILAINATWKYIQFLKIIFQHFFKQLFFLFLFQNHACTCTGNWIWREFYLHDFGYILEHSFITILITCHSLENDKKKPQAWKVSQHLKENIQLNHKQKQNNLYQSKQISNYQYKFRQKMEYHIQLFSSQVLYAF